MARIGIDARFYGSIGKGLGRYTEKLIQNLEKIDSQNQYFIFLRKENFDAYLPKNPNFKKILADYGWYSFSEQLIYPFCLYRYRLDLMHFPHFNVPLLYWKKIVVTIHDLILLHFPTVRNTTLNPVWYRIKFLVYKAVIFAAIMRAARVITISNFTKKDLQAHYALHEQRVVVTYEACNDYCIISPKSSDEILQKYGILKPYIMYVGNAYPHKNLERLVAAFEGVLKKEKDVHLVLVGKEDYFYQRLKVLVTEKKIQNVIFSGFVTDEDLDTVYRESMLYVFPSLYEGFGLPPLEAMAKGVPVIATNHACMKEILGEAAVYFEGTDVDSIKEAILTCIDDASRRDVLRARGLQQVQKYSWEAMAKETLAVYNKTNTQ